MLINGTSSPWYQLCSLARAPMFAMVLLDPSKTVQGLAEAAPAWWDEGKQGAAGEGHGVFLLPAGPL